MTSTPLLDGIDSPADLKKLSRDALPKLANELLIALGYEGEP